MSGLVLVTAVEMKADDDPLSVQIVVQRMHYGMIPGGTPSASDVPQDVRAALYAWLDTAEPKEPA